MGHTDEELYREHWPEIGWILEKQGEINPEEEGADAFRLLRNRKYDYHGSDVLFIQSDGTLTPASSGESDRDLETKNARLTIDRFRCDGFDEEKQTTFLLNVSTTCQEKNKEVEVSFLRQFTATAKANVPLDGLVPFKDVPIAQGWFGFSIVMTRVMGTAAKATLSALGDKTISKTLDMAGVIHPALESLSKIGVELAKGALKQHSEEKIFDATWSLHGDPDALTRPKLRSGSYAIILMRPNAETKFQEMYFNREKGYICFEKTHCEIDYNYFLISITLA